MVKLVISRLCFVIALLMISAFAICQQAQNKLEKIIEVRVNKIRLDSLIKTLAKQSNINFSYNSQNIIPSSTVTISVHRQSLSNWLQELNKNFHIEYTIFSDHIILKSNVASKKINTQKIHSTIKKKVSTTVKIKPVTLGKLTSTIAVDTIIKSSNNVTVKDSVLKHEQPAGIIATTDTIQPKKNDTTSGFNIIQQPGKNKIADTIVRKTTLQQTKKVKTRKLRETNYQLPKNLMISLGANVSKPSFFSKGISSNAMGLGIDIKAEKLVFHSVSGVAEIGYNHFSGAYTYRYYDGDTAKSAMAKNFSNYPLLGGIKLNVYQGVYLSAKAGVALKGGINTNTAFAFSLSAGCVFLHHFDAGIKLLIINSGIGIPYPSPQSAKSRQGRYGLLSLRLAYVF